MPRPLRLVILALLLVSSPGALAQMHAAPLPALSEPAISPDGSEIAFVAGGDIWTVAASGGEARLLVAHPAITHARQGVIVDVRNNNGGFVNGYALDVFSRRGYMNLAPRDVPPAPSRIVLGQRALELPTLLVTNQHSLSDAEDFTEGYRSLRLGRVVGEPTAGWIIYTSNVSLIDGTILRVPATRVTAGDGSDMEMHPRPVDVEVHRDVGESDRGIDTQLDRAVHELLGQLALPRGPVGAGK